MQGLLKEAEGRYAVPSRTKFSNVILPQLRDRTAMLLKQLIKSYMSEYGEFAIISITTDGWTSPKAVSFVTYTIHIVVNFTICSYVLATRELADRHTATVLSNDLMQTLKYWVFSSSDCGEHLTKEPSNSSSVPTSVSMSDGVCTIEDDTDDEAELEFETDEEDEENSFLSSTAVMPEAGLQGDEDIDEVMVETESGIDSRVLRRVVLTTDNASNMTKAARESGVQHVRCFAHSINLSVQKFVRMIDDHLARIRTIVRFFHKSAPASTALKVCLLLI